MAMPAGPADSRFRNLKCPHVSSRRDCYRRRPVRAVGGHCRQAPQPRLPGPRTGRSRELHLQISAARWSSSRRPNSSKSAGSRPSSPYDKPTRLEALRYYRKVVDTFDLQIAYDETVTSVESERAGGAGKAGGLTGGRGRPLFCGDALSARRQACATRPHRHFCNRLLRSSGDAEHSG